MTGLIEKRVAEIQIKLGLYSRTWRWSVYFWWLPRLNLYGAVAEFQPRM